MDNRELKAMISLLDDSDGEIVNAVIDSLMGRGEDVIPELETAWESALNEGIQDRIENLIQILQFASLKEEFRSWVRAGAFNILEGAYLIAKSNFPGLKYAEIHQLVETIKKDVWLEINDNLTALEKTRIMNYIIYQVHRFGRNSSGLFVPEDSYINQVIETRKGNHYTLAILYLSVTWKLGLPVYGVDLPGNFLLAYQDEGRFPDPVQSYGDALFYINPYARGAVLGRQEIEHYVSMQQLEPQSSYYEPCSNSHIIGSLIRHLMHSHEKSGSLSMVKRLRELHEIATE